MLAEVLDRDLPAGRGTVKAEIARIAGKKTDPRSVAAENISYLACAC